MEEKLRFEPSSMDVSYVEVSDAAIIKAKAKKNVGKLLLVFRTRVRRLRKYGICTEHISGSGGASMVTI